MSIRKGRVLTQQISPVRNRSTYSIWRRRDVGRALMRGVVGTKAWSERTSSAQCPTTCSTPRPSPPSALHYPVSACAVFNYCIHTDVVRNTRQNSYYFFRISITRFTSHLPWCASDPTDALGDGRSNVSSHRERCRPRRHNICDIDTTCARPSIVTVDPTVWTDNRDPEIYQTVYTQHEYATVRSDQNSNSSKLVRSVSV